MGGLTVLGIVLIVLGVVLMPFTCFTSLIGVVVGIICILLDRKEEQRSQVMFVQPVYAQQPTYAPQPQYAPAPQYAPQQQTMPPPQYAAQPQYAPPPQYVAPAPQPNARTCMGCGRIVPMDYRFCPYCGK